MDDAIERTQGLWVGENEFPQSLPIDGAVSVQDLTSKGVDDLTPCRQIRQVDLMAHLVGIDHRRSQLFEHLRHGTLSRADAAGESNHRDPIHHPLLLNNSAEARVPSKGMTNSSALLPQHSALFLRCQTAIDFRQEPRQLHHVLDHDKLPCAAHLREIRLPLAVYRNAKGMNALAASLLQCYLGILNAILLAASILAVVKILWIAVGQQNQGLQTRRPPVELLNRMSDWRSHACAAIWFEHIDAVFDRL